MTQVFAHRGAHLSERENTLEAFREAIRLGVDGVELDVRRTADGVLVVHHDPLIDGVALGHRQAGDLPSYVPTLDEAMEVLRGTTVNVEIKNSRSPKEPTYDDTGSFVYEVLDYLHDADLEQSIILSCFDLTTCAQARSYDLEVRVAWLVWDVLLPDALTRAHVLGLNAVNPYFTLVTKESVDVATEMGLAINAWTVNTPEEITGVSAFGVSSVITDQPALAMELLASSTS
ncbi:MAG TPA: glycerophosphodiester phosphodiesterase [Acidimicrobiales bacterium]|nr:glycerophosphodiester phosphodiesterase [Acidimicrobiales bacterium]